jgi:lambda family phage portal protein
MPQLNEVETRQFLKALERKHKAQDRAAQARLQASTDFDDLWGGNWGSGFDAAKRDRLNGDWNPGTVGPNRLHQMDARVLRERVRDLDRNNPKATAAINAFLRNVVGTGITPKPRVLNRDQGWEQEDEWNAWGGLLPESDGECDLAGRRTIYDLQSQVLREVLVGGGCLVHYGERPLKGGRRHPLAIELIPEERIADDRDNWLAGDGRTNPDTGNPIVRGVELDPQTGRHLAYWVKPAQVNDVGGESLTPQRLPAERCRYITLLTLTGQVRGFSLLAPVVIWLQKLGYYLESELVASNMKSQWAYMVQSGDDFPEQVDTLLADDGSGLTDAYGNTIDQLSRGMIWRGKPGDKIEAVGPNVPQADSIPWIQLIEQSIAQGVDLSSVELTRDYSRVNFSSVRAAANRDRKTFVHLQQFVINHFCNPTWRRFVSGACRVLLPGFPTPSAYADNPREALRVTWRCPGWVSVNPIDDANANRIRLQDATTTREKIVAEEGGDWEELADQWEEEQDRVGPAGQPAPVATMPQPSDSSSIPDTNPNDPEQQSPDANP